MGKKKVTKKELTREFFTKRFGKTPEQDPDYYSTWETRMYSDDPELWMDKKSRKVYKKLLKSHTVD